MKHPTSCAPLVAGVLLLGGTAACNDDPAPAEQQLDLEGEDLTPGVDPGEDPVLEDP